MKPMPRCEEIPPELRNAEKDAEQRKRNSIDNLINQLGGLAPEGDAFERHRRESIDADKRALEAKGR